MNLTGIWTGTIVYGKMYRNHAGKEMIFEMKLVQENQEITGTCRDVSGVGLNSEPATIKGSIVKNNIEFIKQYPTLHYYQKSETKTDPLQKSKEIRYFGSYDIQSHVFTGVWEYINTKKLLGIFSLKNPSGKWTMHR
jgi:hypothetical protein